MMVFCSRHSALQSLLRFLRLVGIPPSHQGFRSDPQDGILRTIICDGKYTQSPQAGRFHHPGKYSLSEEEGRDRLSGLSCTPDKV